MKKSLYMLLGTLVFALASYGQAPGEKEKAIRDKIDKAVKDPNREKNSAKADLRIFEKKKILRK